MEASYEEISTTSSIKEECGFILSLLRCRESRVVLEDILPPFHHHREENRCRDPSDGSVDRETQWDAVDAIHLSLRSSSGGGHACFLRKHI